MLGHKLKPFLKTRCTLHPGRGVLWCFTERGSSINLGIVSNALGLRHGHLLLKDPDPLFPGPNLKLIIAPEHVGGALTVMDIKVSEKLIFYPLEKPNEYKMG